MRKQTDVGGLSHSVSRLSSARVAMVLALLGSLSCATQGPTPEVVESRLAGSPAELRSLLGTEEDIEEILLTAKVGNFESLDTGVTRPSRVTLTKGNIRIRALWKTIDMFSPVTQFADGTREMRFRDTYRNEIAAYELAKLLGLSMVPPAVERKISRTHGCVQLWMEGTRTLAELRQLGTRAPDVERWNLQRDTVHLFHQLIYDTDWRNVGNILVDEDFNLYIIDSSRAFRLQGELPPGAQPLRWFSRSLLERLRALTPELLEKHLRRWISREQIAAVLVRRDLIVKLAESQIAARGEEAVLF